MLMPRWATRNQLTTILITPPLMRVSMVSFSLPEAWRTAFSISTRHTKKEAIPIMLSRPGPAALLLG